MIKQTIESSHNHLISMLLKGNIRRVNYIINDTYILQDQLEVVKQLLQ